MILKSRLFGSHMRQTKEMTRADDPNPLALSSCGRPIPAAGT
jgi:hypothetical protein